MKRKQMTVNTRTGVLASTVLEGVLRDVWQV